MLLSNNLHKYPLNTSAVKLPVEDLLPGAKVEFAIRYGHDNLASHDLAFHVGIGVILAGSVVVITLGRRVEGGQLLKPFLVILVQPGFIVIYEHGRGYMHRVHEYKAIPNATLANGSYNARCDIDEPYPVGKVHRQNFTK